MYLRKLSPIVKSKKSNELLPAWYLYTQVQKIFQIEDNNVPQELVDKYRKQVLGDSVLVSAPDEYWEIGLICDIGISLKEWKTLDIDDQAKIMARHYLENMVETINAHYRAQEENEKRNSNKES